MVDPPLVLGRSAPTELSFVCYIYVSLRCYILQSSHIPRTDKLSSLQDLHPRLSRWSRSSSTVLLVQGCGLGLDFSVSRPSRDVLTSRLGLVSDKVLNVSVLSRSRTCASRVSSRSRPKRSRRLVSGLGPFHLVETFHTGAPSKTSVLRYKPVCLSP